MTDKFELYDVLSVLIPGTLLVGLVPVCFPALLHVQGAKFPEAFAVLLLTGLAVFLGFITQALGSLIEPSLEKTWGGRPSRIALKEGLGQRYLGKDEASRIRVKLVKAVGEGESEASLFRYAAQISDAAGVGRSTRFNGLYAYHRSLLTAGILSTLLFLGSSLWGAAAELSPVQKVLVLLAALALLALLWHRTRQRSLYFAAEVLLTAERVIEGRGATSQPQDDRTTAAGTAPGQSVAADGTEQTKGI